MPNRVALDEADVRTLSALQEDGVISKRVTLLNPERLGLELIVFVSIKTSEHSEEWLSHLPRWSTRCPKSWNSIA